MIGFILSFWIIETKNTKMPDIAVKERKVKDEAALD